MLLIPLQAASSWSSPVNVSQNPGAFPAVCCDPDGNPIAVWLEGDIQSGGGSVTVHGSIYKNGVWQPSDQISNEFELAWPPQLCCDASGHAIVLWAELNPTSALLKA